MKAVIMAGGEGSRLRPLTCDRPKPMVPVANRPVMEYIVDLLRNHGFAEVHVTLQYLPDLIMDHFGTGSDFGIKMNYHLEEVPLGTAGSVKNASDNLNDTFLVISGDALTDFDLKSLVDFHKERGAIATLALTRVDTPLEYGVVITEPGGRITRFLEKPGWGQVFSDTVNTGIYVLEPEVLDLVPPGQVFDFSKDLFPRLLAAGRPLYGCVLDGYWCDIGNLDQYLQANFDLLEGRVGFKPAGREIIPRVWAGAGVEIEPGAKVEGPAVIGDGTFLAAGVRIEPPLVLGKRVIVDQQASLKRSVIWNQAYIGPKAELRQGILAERVRVEGGARVYEGSVLGTGATLGQRSTAQPGVKIWPGKIVEPAVLVDSSIVWADRRPRRLTVRGGIEGRINIDLTPEWLTKFGAALGAVTGGRGPAVCGADSHRAAQLAKQALAVGLMGAGLDVYDLGQTAVPVTRYLGRSVRAVVGLHVRAAADGFDSVRTELYGPEAEPLTPDLERKLEAALFREDFARARGDKMGTLTFWPGAEEAYLSDLFSRSDHAAIHQRGFRVAVSCDPKDQTLVERWLTRLGCLVTMGQAGDFGSQVDIGILLEPGTERVHLFDERGIRIEDRVLDAMEFLMWLEQPETPCKVTIPVGASRVIEDLARERQREVSRGKARGSMSLGGLPLVTRILQWMARDGARLSDLTARIPEIRMVERTIPCPWEVKGRVMRTLVEVLGDMNPDLTDGIRLSHDRGWVLVRPDPDEPIYRVLGEGDTWEVAEELTETYAKRVEELVKG